MKSPCCLFVVWSCLLLTAYLLMHTGCNPQSTKIIRGSIMDPNEETIIKSNIRTMVENGWKLEIWTEGHITQPFIGIALYIRLVNEADEVSIPPKVKLHAELRTADGRILIRQKDCEPIFFDPSKKGFKSRQEWNGDNDQEDFTRIIFPVARTWEAVIPDVFHSHYFEDPKAVPLDVGEYLIQVDLALENGPQFHANPLTMDVRRFRQSGPIR